MTSSLITTTHQMAVVLPYLVSSGGTCNILEVGERVLNLNRTELNQRLLSNGFQVFDPQIHESTHGENYDAEKHGPSEEFARENSLVNIYEISKVSPSSVTLAEIGEDLGLGRFVIIIWTDKSGIPARVVDEVVALCLEIQRGEEPRMNWELTDPTRKSPLRVYEPVLSGKHDLDELPKEYQELIKEGIKSNHSVREWLMRSVKKHPNRGKIFMFYGN